MKNIILLSITIAFASVVFAQGAGNFMFSQQKASKSYEESYYLDNIVSEGQYYQGTSTTDNSYSRINDTLLYIDANVLKNLEADSYQIMLGLSQVGESLEVCHSLLNERIEGFKAELVKLNIEQDAVFTDFVSQAPIFAIEIEKKLFSKKYVEIPKGFELKKNLHIKYQNIEEADKIIELAAKYEIYDIIKVDYFVNDIAAVYDEIRTEYVTIINSKLEDYQVLNISSDAMYTSLEESHSCSYPIERYDNFMSYTPETYKALSQTARLSHGNANINIYYNRIPYNKYDKVINPVVNVPVVQFSYFCRLEIVLKAK